MGSLEIWIPRQQFPLPPFGRGTDLFLPFPIRGLGMGIRNE